MGKHDDSRGREAKDKGHYEGKHREKGLRKAQDNAAKERKALGTVKDILFGHGGKDAGW